MSVLYSYFFSISFFKIIFVKACLVFKLCQRELECSKSPPYLPPLRVGKTFGNSWAGTCIAECLQDSETVSYSEQWLWIHILEWHLPNSSQTKQNWDPRARCAHACCGERTRLIILGCLGSSCYVFWLIILLLYYKNTPRNRLTKQNMAPFYFGIFLMCPKQWYYKK